MLITDINRFPTLRLGVPHLSALPNMFCFISSLAEDGLATFYCHANQAFRVCERLVLPGHFLVYESSTLHERFAISPLPRNALTISLVEATHLVYPQSTLLHISTDRENIDKREPLTVHQQIRKWMK